MLRKELALVVLAFLPLRVFASDKCDSNQTIYSYLSAHPGWHVVDSADLVDDDRALWRRYHRGLCPGIAIANFGNGGRSYVLALVLTSARGRQEELVALKRKGSQFSENVLSPPYPAGQLSVVWRAGPGEFREWDTRRSVSVKHDSVVYEVMESAAILFYWSGGAFHTLQTAD